MKVLIVCSGNNGSPSPFIVDQVQAIEKLDVKTEYYFIEGKGISGYLKGYSKLMKKIRDFRPNIVHAHYGLSGLLSTLQRKIPVIITFHGCDINLPKNRILSNLASKLGRESIYVSKELADLSKQKNAKVIPCGVDLDVFYPQDKILARKKMGLEENKQYILFSSSFSNMVKNYPLAKEAVDSIENKNLELLELKGYTRDEVALLMNAVDLVLLTSLREGSPQFIKEALACNTPVVSVNVGDIRDLLEGVEGNFLSDTNASSVAHDIQEVLVRNNRTAGRDKVLFSFDNKKIAKEILALYKTCL